MDEEEAAYNRWKQPLLESLDGILSSGDFAVSRRYQIFANPGLQIAGHEAVIPLPITDHDAETIRGACKAAPFGKGDETLVDLNVRNTWELDAAQFECTNPVWPANFDRILKDVSSDLGLLDVHAKPHKLLLYDKGSFFKRHKDSEKEVGMIGTLVICLPGAHGGGDVHLSFGSQRRELTTAPASALDITALAWYSDVDHEVKPLEFGHRLVLTYKLFQAGDVEQSPQLFFKQSQQLKGILSNWQAQFPDYSVLIYPLDHQYTQSSMSLKNTKGRDRAVCHSLQEIVDACDLYLALAHMTHMTAAEDQSFHGCPNTTLDAIYSLDGARIAKDHYVHESDILVSNMFEDRSPDSGDEAEFTGNESTPAFSRYHDTVVVLIPKHRIHSLLKTGYCAGTRDRDAENLTSMVKQDFRKHQDSPAAMSNTLQVMTNILGTSVGSQSTIPCIIAKWALETNHEGLFQEALRSAVCAKEFPMKLLGSVSRLLDQAYAKDATDFDWQQLFGHFWRSSSLGVWDSTSKMLKARLVTTPLQDSFSLWARSQLDLKLDERGSFTIEDHDFFVDGIGSSEISDKLHSVFSLKATRELIYKVLESLFHKRDLYNQDTIKRIFEETLEIARSRIALQPHDLLELQKPGPFSFGSLPRDHKSRLLLQHFTAVVKQGLEVGVSDKAILLVEESHRGFKAAGSSWDPSRISQESLTQELLVPLASAFHSCQVLPTLGVKSFFELLIRDVLHHQGPKHPENSNGWRRDLESRLAPLRGPCFRDLLGDTTYQEIVELEPLQVETAPGPVAGVKRSSGSDLAGDSVRQRL